MRIIAISTLTVIGALNVQAGVGHALKQTGCVVTRLHKCHKKAAKPVTHVQK